MTDCPCGKGDEACPGSDGQPLCSDTVVAMLSRGEYRVPQATLDYYGEKLLTEINRMPLDQRPAITARLMDDIKNRPSKGLQDDAAFAAGGYVRGTGKSRLLSHPYAKGPDAWPRNVNEEFAAKQRRLSPKYPTLDEARHRRRERQHEFVSRFCILVVALGGIAMFSSSGPWWGFGLVGVGTGAYIFVNAMRGLYVR